MPNQPVPHPVAIPEIFDNAGPAALSLTSIGAVRCSTREKSKSSIAALSRGLAALSRGE